MCSDVAGCALHKWYLLIKRLRCDILHIHTYFLSKNVCQSHVFTWQQKVGSVRNPTYCLSYFAHLYYSNHLIDDVSIKVHIMHTSRVRHIQDLYLVHVLRFCSGLCPNAPNVRSIQCVKTTTGQRSFHFAAAKIWNGLPAHIRSFDSFDTFKKHLKTHLHTLSYCT